VEVEKYQNNCQNQHFCRKTRQDQSNPAIQSIYYSLILECKLLETPFDHIRYLSKSIHTIEFTIVHKDRTTANLCTILPHETTPVSCLSQTIGPPESLQNHKKVTMHTNRNCKIWKTKIYSPLASICTPFISISSTEHGIIYFILHKTAKQKKHRSNIKYLTLCNIQKNLRLNQY